MKETFKVTIKGTGKFFLGILICSLISSFFTIFLTKFISYIVDGIIMKTSHLPRYIEMFLFDDSVMSKMLILLIFMLSFVLVIAISNYIKSMLNTKFKLKLNKNLKEKLLEHTTYLEYSEHISYGKSSILQRVSSDSNKFIDFITSKYNLVVDSIFILLFSMIEILNMNLFVSITIIIIILIIIIMSVIYFKVTKEIVRKNVDLSENLISRTMNAVYYPKMIKIFNRQKKEITDFAKVSDEYRKNDKKLIDYLIYYELIGGGIRAFRQPVLFLVGGLFIISGKMNVGQLMVLMTYSSNLLEYVLQLIYAVEGINEFLIPARRISEFLNLKEENGSNKETALNDISVEFRNVAVNLNNNLILDNVSFKLKKGDKVYLVGDNGSGKSLIIKVLLGFTQYTGEVLLGGVDIKNLNREVIRDNIGVVFEEPFVFSDTIKNNIDVFGKCTIDDVKKVASLCEIDEEIEKLECKYNELLGERGINLSGGQKQRISIARVLLQERSIMFFDDVLSKLDRATKSRITQNLSLINKDKISVYITHELSSIPDNETVMFIDNKKLVYGTQKDLKQSNENYMRLINICDNIVGEVYE